MHTLVLLVFIAISIHCTAAHLHSPGAHAVRRHAFETRGIAFPDDWFHSRSHPVNALFQRTAHLQERDLPYPGICKTPPNRASGDPTTMPSRWVSAYNAAKSAGLIPSIPQTVLDASGDNPTYPNGLDGHDPSICSTTNKCPQPGDIWDAPDGVLVVNFDDGPIAIGPDLYAFLQAHNLPSTHFMIGCSIFGDQETFKIAYQTLHASIAAHTWSHPYMTSLPDLQQVAELGWSLQIISDLTGGRVARYWRPPHGDCDLRCRAIATHVFGLTTVMWNNDSEDWQMTDGYPGSKVAGNITNWVNGPKHPGLIILEHELTNDTVSYFKNTTYPLAVKNNWTFKNVPQAFAEPYYLNAADDLVTPSSLAIAVDATAITGTTPTAAKTGATGTTGSTSASQTSSHSGTSRSAQAPLSLSLVPSLLFVCLTVA